MQAHDFVGITGVFLILGAYSLLQLGRLDVKQLRYSVANAVGASFVIISLVFEFNLAALVVESFWLAISFFGIWKWGYQAARKRAREAN